MRDIQEILKQHASWLRGEKEGLRASLSGANLSGVDLSKANLSKANLSKAYLSEANFFKANLSGADMSEANLSGVDFSGADLSGADLFMANLFKANLSEANMFMAHLHGANLHRADLSRTKQVIMKFSSSRDEVFSIDNMVYIGCKSYSIDYWLLNYEEIGLWQKYTPQQIEEYGLILKHIKAVLKIRRGED